MVSKKTVLCTLYALLLIGGLFVDVTPVNATPSTVATSTDGTPTAFPAQRKTFYAASRHWVFYSDDGDNLVLKTSTDGSTWSGATAICPSATGYYFSVWFDGTYVHYAREYPTNFDLYYRRGTPNSDGTITWSAVEQQIHDGISSDFYAFPVISVDTDGYVWIGTSYSGTLPYVWKNANTDGTWSTEEGFPYKLSATTGSWFVTPIPLTGGKVYVIYCKAATVPYGKLYNAGWGDEESDLADYTNEQYFTYSAVAISDDVYFTYNRDVNQIRFNKRTYGTGWGAVDVLVQDTVESTTVPVLYAQTATNELYVFWVLISTDHVYYKKYSGGSWDASATDWIDESTDDFSTGYGITCSYEDSGQVGVVYSTKLASPYNIRYDFLSFNSAPTASTLTAPADATVFDPSEVGTFSWTFNDPDGGDTQGAYQIQFDEDSEFSSTYYDSEKVISSSSSILVTAPSVAGTYYWRVKTWDAADAEGEWSTSLTFIINSAPTAPTLELPGDGTRYDPSESMACYWTFVDPDSGDTQGAYQLQVDDNSDFSSTFYDSGKVTSDTNTKAVISSSTLGLYYWRVKTWDNSDAEGAWSSSGTVIVDQINLLTLSSNSISPTAGDNVIVSATVALAYDGHLLGTGDTFSMNAYTFTYDTVDAVWKWEHTEGMTATVTLTSYTASEVTYGISTVDVDAGSLAITITWSEAPAGGPSGGGGTTDPTPPDDTTPPVDDIVNPDGTITHPDGSIEYPNGVILLPDGTIVLPDGTTYPPNEDGTPQFDPGEVVIIYPDGTTVLPDGTIVLPDGTVLPPGSALPVSATSGSSTTSPTIYHYESPTTVPIIPPPIIPPITPENKLMWTGTFLIILIVVASFLYSKYKKELRVSDIWGKKLGMGDDLQWGPITRTVSWANRDVSLNKLWRKKKLFED